MISLLMRKPNAKDRILETAGELFFQRGYSGVGINEIIEKAGTAKASFYQHFPSKESLCEAWLRDMHDRSSVHHGELLASGLPPQEMASAYFTRLADFLKAGDFRGCPYSNTGAVSDENCLGIVKLIRLHKESTRVFFRKIASLAISDPARSETIGDRLFVLYSGATAEAQNLKSLWPVEIAREAAEELLT
jgi:AcrR family transcriptional regulator